MCQLRGHVHPALEEGRHGALPLQRLRALPQDERHQPALVQTPEEAGESASHVGQGCLPGRGEKASARWRWRGYFSSSGPHLSGAGGSGPDFQNKQDYLEFGELQGLVLSRLVVQRPDPGQVVKGAAGKGLQVN